MNGTSIIKGESGSLQTEFTNSDSLFTDNKYRVNKTKGKTHFSMSKFSFSSDQMNQLMLLQTHEDNKDSMDYVDPI